MSTAFSLRCIGSHLSQEERNCQVIQARINMAGILVAFLLVAHRILIACGTVIAGMHIAEGMVIGKFGHLQ